VKGDACGGRQQVWVRSINSYREGNFLEITFPSILLPLRVVTGHYCLEESLVGGSAFQVGVRFHFHILSRLPQLPSSVEEHLLMQCDIHNTREGCQDLPDLIRSNEKGASCLKNGRFQGCLCFLPRRRTFELHCFSLNQPVTSDKGQRMKQVGSMTDWASSCLFVHSLVFGIGLSRKQTDRRPSSVDRDRPKTFSAEHSAENYRPNIRPKRIFGKCCRKRKKSFLLTFHFQAIFLCKSLLFS
jgi:hypothetical protein